MSASAFLAAAGTLSSTVAAPFVSPSTSTTLKPCGPFDWPLNVDGLPGGCADADAIDRHTHVQITDRRNVVRFMCLPFLLAGALWIEIGIEHPDDARAAWRRELQ